MPLNYGSNPSLLAFGSEFSVLLAVAAPALFACVVKTNLPGTACCLRTTTTRRVPSTQPPLVGNPQQYINSSSEREIQVLVVYRLLCLTGLATSAADFLWLLWMVCVWRFGYRPPNSSWTGTTACT